MRSLGNCYEQVARTTAEQVLVMLVSFKHNAKCCVDIVPDQVWGMRDSAEQYVLRVELMRVELPKAAAAKPVPPKLPPPRHLLEDSRFDWARLCSASGAFYAAFWFCIHIKHNVMHSAELMSCALLCAMYIPPVLFAPRNRSQFISALTLLEGWSRLGCASTRELGREEDP